jgi:hypothetical protein
MKRSKILLQDSKQMKVLLALVIITLSQIYARNITNSLDGYISDTCHEYMKQYYLEGDGMSDIALQYDLKSFTAPVRKATFNLLPFFCFNTDRMRVSLKTSADEISFSRPCKKYDYDLIAFLNIEDSTCQQSVDITLEFNDAIRGNKKLQLFLVDTWIPFCDSIVPGTQQTPSCQINFQGISDSPSHQSSFQIEVIAVEETQQQTTLSPVASTHAPTTPATSSVTTPTTTFSIPSETTVKATPSPTSQNNDQSGQNNSSKQERNSAIKELLSISTLMIAAIVLN